MKLTSTQLVPMRSLCGMKFRLIKEGILKESVKQNNRSWVYQLINSNKETLEQKKQDYVNRFTVHGLTKVFKAKGLECFFWIVTVIVCTFISIFVVHGLVDKYLEYAVLTELTFQTTRINIFPSITFCERKSLMRSYFSYCSSNDGSFLSHVSCAVQTEHLLKRRAKHHKQTHKVTSKTKRYWSNGLFNVSLCYSIGKKNCLHQEYFESIERLDDTCFTWNPNGNFHDVYGGIDVHFTYHHGDHQDDSEIIVIAHDAEIKELDITNRVIIEPYKKYNIRIDKTLVKRLPYPFPTNCTKEKNGDIFPGKYSRRGCLESHNFIEMYKRCGDTFDYVRQYIPEDTKKHYGQNKSIINAKRCIYNSVTSETKSAINCGFPCKEFDFGITSTYYRRNIPQEGDPIYRVTIQLKRVDLYHVIEEKAFLSFEQLACEVGGFLAVVIGASSISLVEVLVYLGISVVQKIY